LKQQGDDAASWWPWNVFKVLVSCYGGVMENRGQGNLAKGASAAGNGGFQNRGGNANPSQAKPIKFYNCNGIVRKDGVTSIKRRRRDLYGDSVRNFMMTSGRDRLKEDLESSTWRRRQDF
ncbi:hypothetical protein Tco_0375643, partial [Tanacetum coccineum]